MKDYNVDEQPNHSQKAEKHPYEPYTPDIGVCKVCLHLEKSEFDGNRHSTNTSEAPTDESWDIRGAIVEMTSTMLDNPKGNIYPTAKFYDRMESFIASLLKRAVQDKLWQNDETYRMGLNTGKSETCQAVRKIVEGMSFRKRSQFEDERDYANKKSGYNNFRSDILSQLDELISNQNKL